MSNVLKALPWNAMHTEDERIFVEHAQGASVFYTVYGDIGGDFGTRWHDQMEGSHGKKEGFASIEEVKHWIETEHYPSKMQPYINNPQAWIDASKQLPQVDKDTQFICAYDSAIEPFSKVVWFNADIGEFNYQHDDVLAWMPIPEFSTMQNSKGGDCE